MFLFKEMSIFNFYVKNEDLFLRVFDAFYLREKYKNLYNVADAF